MQDDLDLRVREAFAKMFPVDAAELDDSARRGELTGWDSLAHLDLVEELEQCFSVTIDQDLALEIETLGDAKRVLAELLGAGG